MHTVFDLRGRVPDSIYITDSCWHDSNCLVVNEPYKRALYTMGKAHVDFDAHYRMHVNQTYFVTRAKNSMMYEVFDTNYNINDLVGIVENRTIHLSGNVSEKKTEDFRMLAYYDAEKENTLNFITTNLELGSLISTNIYHNRWQIETFFRWIEENLTIKALWGYSENAVKIHLWLAISSYLLLAWEKAALKSPLTITEVSQVVETSLLTKSNFRELLDVPYPLTQKQNVNELESNI